MSTLNEFLAKCDAVGIRFTMAGDDGLAIDAPQNALTPNLLERLKANKREIIRLFHELGPCPDCESHRIEIQTYDGFLHLKCPACDRCFGCRPATAEIAEKFRRSLKTIPVLDECGIIFDYVEPCGVCRCADYWWNLLGDRFCSRCQPPSPKASELRRMSSITAILWK